MCSQTKDECAICLRQHGEHNSDCLFVLGAIEVAMKSTIYTIDNGTIPVKETECSECGLVRVCFFRADAHRVEIRDDYTPNWVCQPCTDARG